MDFRRLISFIFGLRACFELEIVNFKLLENSRYPLKVLLKGFVENVFI